LARLVDDHGLNRDDLRESAIHDPARRQHADRAKDDASSIQQPFVFVRSALEFPGFDHVVADDLVEMLVPWITPVQVNERESRNLRNLPIEMEVL
jgi:hypothetical protein